MRHNKLLFLVVLGWIYGRPLTGTEMKLCICKFEAPRFSAVARGGGIQGLVPVRVIYDSEGFPKEVNALEGHPILMGDAVKAVRHWQFCPSHDEARETEVVVNIRFRLEGKAANMWTPTEIRFESSGTVEVTTNPPEPPGPDYMKRD